ncbi:MAG: hypothetical protein Q7T55_20875, partial [Solirubrobacteraceae bacterium]|nr:hypothetical protein [Solirubrobacteraceae bacterium]
RRPSGITSLPIPSPGITAILSVWVMVGSRFGRVSDPSRARQNRSRRVRSTICTRLSTGVLTPTREDPAMTTTAFHRALCATLFGGLGAWHGAACAQAPADVGDLVGARGSSGETQMEARGYRFVKTNTVRDEKWSYWWNQDRRQCVQVATSDGRYSAINAVPGANCGERGDAARAADGRQDENRDGDRRFLTLVCYGEGSKPSVESRSGYRWDPRRHRYEPMQEITSGTQGFDSEVQVEISGQRGRIHLTGKLVAPLHSGDVDHWWELTDLRVDRDRITGRYRMNGLNSPQVEIDRRSGRIQIDGIEHFRGSCDQGQWGDDSRRF